MHSVMQVKMQRGKQVSVILLAFCSRLLDGRRVVLLAGPARPRPGRQRGPGDEDRAVRAHLPRHRQRHQSPEQE